MYLKVRKSGVFVILPEQNGQVEQFELLLAMQMSKTV